MTSLKAFIKSVRSCKTIADERNVVQKEAAAIRSSFRESSLDPHARRETILKLLYLFTLGERTHFGQIECVKLLASSKFTDKRLGYLGTMLLLDENQEVLTLVTNSINNDLNSANPYVVSLALSTLGNIASQEMARDLFQDIVKLLSSPVNNIRKKATICAMRIVAKAPELEEDFVEYSKKLFAESDSDALLATITFAIGLCQNNPALVPQYYYLVPRLVSELKSLGSTGFNLEYEVGGINNPFLQIKILQFLAILGSNNPETTEQMNDTLAQIATNTESSRSMGETVLYECVRTILAVAADSGLRTVGINIFGKFLASKEHNSRYVALNAMAPVAEIEPNAVQRHRNTILACLQDPDVSIRRSALELSYNLINEQTVRVIVRELLAHLEVCDKEFKAGISTQICSAADRFAPDRKWHIDTMIRVLSLSGNYTPEEVLAGFLVLVANSPDLQLYTAQKLFGATKADISQEALVIAAIWVIGEFGDKMIVGTKTEAFETYPDMIINEDTLIDLYSTVLDSQYTSAAIEKYTLTSLIKLSVRLNSPSSTERIRRLIQRFSKALDVDIQERSVEYSNLFGHNDVRRSAAAPMPVPEIKVLERVLKSSANKLKAKPVTKSNADLLLDLMGDEPSQVASTVSATGGPTAGADLLGMNDSEPSASTTDANKNIQDILGLFGDASGPSAVANVSGPYSVTSEEEGYVDENLRMTLEGQREDGVPGLTVLVRFYNVSGSGELNDISLAAAVSKGLKIQVLPIASTSIGNGASTVQKLKVTGPSGMNVKFRLKLGYTMNGSSKESQITFAKFPAGIL
ncbi:hypothetical protein CANCADRAFT_106214 [Tortispora caseinolytica NRRL Y-17796]|uniref:AP-1 complex subunit gamma n=1 Tax=Tortispora caseinolytica NRRL Y-17796 TaxID=767744 RepID=A0A1E4TF43_9ASCO|nr:hypothetical protein CANCADRAFT_106214 [Tortispora caseinolytica NRRL Y-17796]